MGDMRRYRWVTFGLCGGAILSGLTLIRAVTVAGFALAAWATAGRKPPPDFSFGLALAVIVATFAMGFVLGVVTSIGLVLSRRLGQAGDALIGAIVMNVFFAMCSALFARDAIRENWRNGLWIALAATGLGVLLGLWTGRDLRRDLVGAADDA